MPDKMQSKGNVLCDAPHHTKMLPWDRIVPEGEWFYLSDDGEQVCCEKCWENEVQTKEESCRNSN